jgi:hypothetical protein
MQKTLRFILAGVLFLLFSNVAMAQGPQPQHSDPQWQASYWNNKFLNGQPTVTRNEDAIDHDWGSSAPVNGIEDDAFSARWTKYIDVDVAGTFHITSVSDDGMRAFIDGEQIINAWNDHAAAQVNVDKYLATGHHQVVVEYYENAYNAVAKFSISGGSSGPGGLWHGEYYNNLNLTGSPAYVHDDANVDFHWDMNSPVPGTIGADNFSARGTRSLDFPAGNYRFIIWADDGVRLWVNGHLLIDQWHDQPWQGYAGDIYLPGGAIPLKIEYYERTGGAGVSMSWLAVAAITNWKGEYYNNTSLSGGPALVRDDANVSFDWGGGSPAPGVVNSDSFSVRWTRSLDFPAGTYHFNLTTDDGARLWVNGHLLIDQWHDQAPTTYSADIYLPGGSVPVEVNYYENSLNAQIQLSWGAPGVVDQSGTVIVDDTSAGFQRGGLAGGWRGAAVGFGNHLFWTNNNNQIRSGYNWARWNPNLAPGRYEVFAHFLAQSVATNQARYWVSHSGGLTLRLINQNGVANRWQSLGTYWFNGNSHDYISLSDVTYEPYLSRIVVWDAMKWDPR